MEAATEHVRALARRTVAEALTRGPLRAALLAGSGARGDADAYSDVDLLLYVDELPPAGRLDELREALGGTAPVRFGEQTEGFDQLQFEVGGVAVQVVYATVAAVEQGLVEMLGRLEGVVGTPRQKILAGLDEGLALHGEELIGGWQRRVRAYPDGLRRAAIEHHWSFFPLWYYDAALADRDAELWRLDMLLEAAFNVLGVLAALNRVYYARFELKRLRSLERRLRVAPPRLADRLESLFRMPREEAAAELGRLVLETRELVGRELPEVELRLRHPPGTTREPWSVP
jgi:predicted nucleotidyltransferase